MSTESRELTTTSYAILGLLALRPWSTYELAVQMRRNFRYLWPRAESNLYAEPKRLVEGGFARSRREPAGQRERTIYSITKRGRTALERWLREPGADARLEAERIVKILFSPFAGKEDLVAHLRDVLAEARDRQSDLQAIFEEYLAGRDPFPDRVHINVLCYQLLWEQAVATAGWATWALAEVGHWADAATPGDREPFMEILRSALAETG